MKIIKEISFLADDEKTTTTTTNDLDAIFKYTGGKRKEIKHFKTFFPDFVKNKDKFDYVEPFVGGGAVYFYLNNLNGKNIINDFDDQVINFYKEFCDGNEKFIKDLTNVSKITDHDILEGAYYSQRDLDRNNGLSTLTDTQKAVRFFIVNQLAFSGMRRFNSKGEFNVPFGHYKKLNSNIINSVPHRTLLSNTKIIQGDFEFVMKEFDTPNTFQFLDPPYTKVFKKYSHGNLFGEKEQIRLSETLKKIKHAKVMMIINKSELIEKLYSGLIKSSYTLNYGVNIKNRFNTTTEHLIICNY